MLEYNKFQLRQAMWFVLFVAGWSGVIIVRRGPILFVTLSLVLMALAGRGGVRCREEWRYRHIKRWLDKDVVTKELLEDRDRLNWFSPSYFGQPFFETQREQIMSEHLAQVHHCECKDLEGNLQMERAVRNGALDSQPSIHAEDRGGECSRCHMNKPGMKMFMFTSNPSFSFGKPESMTAPQEPTVRHYLACKDCLTDEEIAKLLKPIAFFVLSMMIANASRGSELLHALAHVLARLSYDGGAIPYRLDQTRTEALKALG